MDATGAIKLADVTEIRRRIVRSLWLRGRPPLEGSTSPEELLYLASVAQRTGAGLIGEIGFNAGFSTQVFLTANRRRGWCPSIWSSTVTPKSPRRSSTGRPDPSLERGHQRRHRPAGGSIQRRSAGFGDRPARQEGVGARPLPGLRSALRAPIQSARRWSCRPSTATTGCSSRRGPRRRTVWNRRCRPPRRHRRVWCCCRTTGRWTG